jgi:hypothetical protein
MTLELTSFMKPASGHLGVMQDFKIVVKPLGVDGLVPSKVAQY